MVSGNSYPRSQVYYLKGKWKSEREKEYIRNVKMRQLKSKLKNKRKRKPKLKSKT